HRLSDRMIVVAGDDNRVAIRIDSADHADMAAAAAAHHGDGTDLRPRDASAVTRIGAGEIAAPGVTGALEHKVHEGTAPPAAAPGRIGADVLARLRDQRIAGGAAISRIRM